jgi:hypothetical protein
MGFNRLTDAKAERLALLLEELGEAQQVIGKILRHGYKSTHPANLMVNNGQLLERELGDVTAAVSLLTDAGDIHASEIASWRVHKMEKVQRYLHHQKKRR